MREEQREFFNIMTSFKKLRISSMLPNISSGDFGILKMIEHCSRHCEQESGGDGVRISSIVRNTRMPAPAISRSLRSLEEKGLVERTVDKNDRRNTYVEVTEKGHSALIEMDALMNDFANAVLGQMGEDNLQMLNQYLGKLLHTAEQEIAKRTYKGKKGETEDETHI